MRRTLLHFEGERTRMEAFVIMPNHIHCLFQLMETWTLPKLMHSWRSFSAKELNRITGRRGEVWSRSYWDRIPRGPRHYSRIRDYILDIRQRPGCILGRLCCGSESAPYGSSSRKRDTTPGLFLEIWINGAPACCRRGGLGRNGGGDRPRDGGGPLKRAPAFRRRGGLGRNGEKIAPGTGAVH